MFILDSDTLRAILRHPTPYLQRRITSTPFADLYISVIVAHEMVKGILAELSKNEQTRHVTRHYDFLRNVFSDLNKFQILPYDDEAERIFQTFPPATRRIGLRDCRIAASALSRNFVVITRNLRDFERAGAEVRELDRPTYA